ncbi:unnamed protein product [Cladocopium goreaui]|uniref:Calcium/calmodulin-dependent protein kinase type 1 n=1 Tax=Cladocopium goreaui TaxID=2562237 RepID=A0A9P1BYF9_9DINO|nr:unnamed protein product [Cladocopium goreaui]
MGYRVNGLPPFQVSFSITFPEGYVGKEKMDTKFKVEADDSQVQVGVLNQLARTAKYETNKSSAPTLDADSLELHTKLEALKVIASTASPVLNKCNGRGSIDDDETTEGSERGDLVTATSSLKTLSSDFQEIYEFAAPEDDDLPEVPYCGGEVLATPAGRSRDEYEVSRVQPFVTSIGRGVDLSEPGWDESSDA